MLGSNLMLIVAMEVSVLFLLLCLYLLFQNRKLRRTIGLLHGRMEQLVKDLRTARIAAKAENQSAKSSETYKHFLNEHIQAVRKHHEDLESDRDIVLDIDPATPSSRRAAALRYAVLMAEKEATAKSGGNSADWKLLERKYEQLFNFNQQYAAEPSATDGSELEELREGLASAKKRINNLERFKTLYFDLEEKWENCKDTAKSHFNTLTQLTESAENSEEIAGALHAYHTSYAEVGALIEDAAEGETILSGASIDSSGEIKHLRAVAADQHKIITELQRKLQEANTVEAQAAVVDELQEQLQKQVRFVQESETCIQLMEDELGNANTELEQLRSRLNVLPQLKTNLKDLRDQNDDYEMQVYTLKSENRRLKSKLQSAGDSPPQDDGEVRKLKKEISAAEARYAELEEKFLDLKLQ
ncbi:hypothetical protein SAMN02745866_02226 [Alteromonadaceae bacterium Bs31]|nr:hypothetical protein SAMN02745866_02226 [Alteromonadaceae bacterium Bs31]